jgi:hypothetical protein
VVTETEIQKRRRKNTFEVTSSRFVFKNREEIRSKKKWLFKSTERADRFKEAAYSSNDHVIDTTKKTG